MPTPSQPSVPSDAPILRAKAAGRRAAAFQFGYLLLFGVFAVIPSLRGSPSLVMVAAAVLTAVWLAGCLAQFANLPRADELLLAGCTAPLVVGLLQLSYRAHFVWTHGGFVSATAPGTSAAGFAVSTILEAATVLLPGGWFLWRNARNLTPAPPPAQGAPSLPASRRRRT